MPDQKAFRQAFDAAFDVAWDHAGVHMCEVLAEMFEPGGDWANRTWTSDELARKMRDVAAALATLFGPGKTVN